MGASDKNTVKDAAGTAVAPLSESASLHSELWATVLGLAFARCTTIIGSYGSYRMSDDGMMTDGAFAVSFVLLAICVVWVAASKHYLTKSQNRVLAYGAVVGQVCTLLLLQYAVPLVDAVWFEFVMHGLNEFFGLVLMSYWLRRLRGSSTTSAVMLILSAFIASEVVLYVCVLTDSSLLIAVVLAVLEIPLARMARRAPNAYQLDTPNQRSDYFGFMHDNVTSQRFLAVTALSIGIMAVCIGFLRGFPGGEPIQFTFATRTGYMVLTIVVCLALMMRVAHGRVRVMTVHIWVVMQLLAMAALVSYAAWPDALYVGAMFSTTLNALMVVMVWYMITAFMGFGWRDPYYYAFSGFIVFMLPRAIARTSEGFLMSAGASPVLIGAVISLCVVVSSQFTLMQLMKLQRDQSQQDAQSKQPAVVVQKVLGIDVDQGQTPEQVRRSAMRQNAERMGKQFLLTDREVDVLALYALGYTQQSVAEELFVSPGTVHSHIKRIYEKTGLHSRQAVLDYMKENDS